MNFVEYFNLFGVDAKQIPCIMGSGEPTTATEAVVGCLYMDEKTGYIYKCISSSNGKYTWTSTDKTVAELVDSLADTTKQEVKIARGYVHVDTGAVPGSTTSGTFPLRAYTENLIEVDGDVVIVVPDGYCCRVFYYTPSYERYDDWKTGTIHLNSDEKIYVRLTLAHDNTKIAVTDEDILFIQENLKVNNGKLPDEKSIKILGIGNSYTRDSFRWLWKILKESGFDNVVVGHGYWGGSTLAEQYASIDAADENHTIYGYWKYTTNQNATIKNGATLDSILTDETWDIVVFQQQSDHAGQYDSFVSDVFDINSFIDHVKTTISNDKLRIGIASTWSHATGYTGDKFVTWYDGNPETQYQAINSVIPQVANHMSQCDFVVNTGKAVKLGRENAFLGALGTEMLRSDKNHLAYGIPSYMAGMVYAITLCGINPCKIAWYPTTSDDPEIVSATSAYLAYLAKQCALAASQTI